jgi:Tn3 transposase DDE domain
MQEVLSESDWSQLMSTEDLRGITPLVYVHINPYGKFELNLEERLNIQLAA